MISLSRLGSLTSGIYPLRAGFSASDVAPTSFFGAAYTLREPAGRRQFLADSGGVTLTTEGGRVHGAFVFFASSFAIFPTGGPELGVPVTATAHGPAPLQITGTFDVAPE